MKETIEVRYDSQGIVGGQEGCYIAELQSDRGIKDAGKTRDHAITEVLKTLKTYGYSDDRRDYKIVNV